MTLPHESKEGVQGESKESSPTTTIETDAPVEVKPEDDSVAEQASGEPADDDKDGQ